MAQNNALYSKSQPNSASPPAFAPNCDFMKYLEPSNELVNDQQQNRDEYDQIYKTLSSGVYQSSDAYEVEQYEEEENVAVNQQHKSESLRIQNEVGILSFENQSQSATSAADRNEKSEAQYGQIRQQEQMQNKKVQNMIQNNDKNHLQLNSQKQQSGIHPKVAGQMEKYPSLYDSQQNEQVQMEEREEVQVEDDLQADRVESGEESMKNGDGLYSSVHIYVQESITVPQQHQILKEQAKLVEKINSPSQYEVLIDDEPKIEMKKIEITRQTIPKQESNQSENVKISILGYEQEYFLKIQTQVFQMQVHKHDQQYSINRRFADFSSLQKLVRHHYPGFILYPFPEKYIEFFQKLKLSMRSQQEKIVLIEKRLFELEKYLNFLLTHQEIATSIILEIFLYESNETFQKELSNLLSVSLEQEKELQLGVIEENYNSIKKMMKSGLNFFNNYLSSSQGSSDSELQLKQLQSLSNKNNEIFSSIRVELSECTEKLASFTEKIEKLAAMYKGNSQISNIDSNIDSVLKLSSKLSSSRSFYQKYSEWIENNLIYQVKHYALLLHTISESIDYRGQLLSKINSISVQQIQIGHKIEEKIQLFDYRFIKDWSSIVKQLDQNLTILYEKFNNEWKNHCKLMSKIWK